MIELIIAATSIPALYLVASPNKYQRWGFIIGFTGQPFWIWSTFYAHDYGKLAVSVFCTWTWAIGIWNYWIVPLREQTKPADTN